jgi:hypothetical protein
MTSSIWNTGTSGGWGTIGSWSGGIPNSTTADATIAAAGTYTVTVETGKTYTVDSVTLNDSSAILDIVGTLNLAGTLALMNIAAGTLELAGAVSGGTVDITGGATLEDLGGTLKNISGFSLSGGASINLDGHTLNLGGTSTLQGYIYNPGELILSGLSTFSDDPYFEAGTTLDITGITSIMSNVQFDPTGSGTGTGAAVLSIASGAALILASANNGWTNDGTLSVNNAGFIENTSGGYYNLNYTSFVDTGTIIVGAGSDISLLGSFAALNGVISGAGELYLNGGTVLLQTGLVPTIATLYVDSSETVQLQANLIYAGQLDANYSADLQLENHTLTVSGIGGAIRGYVDGLGTLDITGTYDVGGLYLGAGAEELVSGTAIDDTSNTRLDYNNGSTPSILSISSTGKYDITAANDQIDSNGAQGTIINAGLFENTGTAGYYFNIYDGVTNTSTGTLFAGAGQNLSFYGTTNDFSGTIGGAKIFLGGGTTTLEAALALNVATFAIGNSAIAILEGNRNVAGTLSAEGGSTLDLNGYNLTLSGSGNLADYIEGPGTLVVTGTYINDTGLDLGGGVTEILSGTEVQDNTSQLDYTESTIAGATISITGTGTYDIASDTELFNYANYAYNTIVNAGLFEKTGYDSYSNIYVDFTNSSTGTVLVGGGYYPNGNGDDLSFLGASNDFSGTITGQGNLYFGQGGTTTLEAALSISNSLADFTVSDGNTQLILESSRTFADGFTDQSGGDVQLNGNTLTLAGKSAINNAYVSGPGALVITGQSDFNGAVFVGTVSILDAGTITQDGYDELGNTNTAQVTLSIASGAVYDILNDNQIDPQNGGPIINDGLFEKTGANGVSDIYSVIINNPDGTINAVHDTLRFHSGGTLAGLITGANGEVDLNGGTFTLDAGATINVGEFYVNGGDLVLDENLSLTTGFVLASSGTLNLNGFNVSLDNPSDYLAGNYITGPGTVTEAARADINGLNLAGGAVLVDTGTITQDGGFNIGTSSSDSATLDVAAAGTFAILNDNQIGTNGAAATINNAGLFEKTADNGGSNIYASFNDMAGGTLDVVAGNIQLLGGGTLAGAIIGAGTLYLNQEAAGIQYTYGSTAAISIATLDVNGGTLVLGGSHSLSNTFIETSGDINLNGFNLTLSGADRLDNAYLTGPGMLDVTGTTELNNYYASNAATILDAGTILADGSNLNLGQASSDSITLSITSAGVYDFINDSGIVTYAGQPTGTINNAGLIEHTDDNGTSVINAALNNTGTINAIRGALNFQGGGTLGGTLEGGTIQLDGGTFSLLSTAVLTATNLQVYYNTDLILESNRTIATTFALEPNYGGTLSLNGHNLTLSGNNDYLADTIAGAGTVDVTGAATMNGQNLTAGAVLLDAGSIVLNGNVQIGETGTDTAAFSIAATGTLNLQDNLLYTSGAGSIVNAGLIVKSISGTQHAYIQTITNTGTIEVLTGTLEIGSLFNDGLVTVTNGTVQTDQTAVANAGDTGTFSLGNNAVLYEEYGLAATQTVNFSGTDADLEIGQNASFAATITNFGTTDTIDVLGNYIAFGTYANGELTFFNNNGTAVGGIAIANLNTTGLDFITDGNGGTELVYNNNATQPPTAISSDNFTVSSGDFNTAADWSGGVPGALNNAVDTNGGTITDSGNNTVYELSFNNGGQTFSQTAGTLNVLAGGGLENGFGSGVYQQAAGAVLANESGTLFIGSSGGGVDGTIAGTLTGTGVIQLGGEGGGTPPVTIAGSAVLTVATLSVSAAILTGNQTYAGVFELPGALYLNGYTMTVTGQDYLAPTYGDDVYGTGELVVSGTAHTAVFDVHEATLDVTGTFIDDQELYLSANTTASSLLTIAAGGTVDMSYSQMYTYPSGANGTVENAGLLNDSSGSGQAIQNVNLTQASTGTLNVGTGAFTLISSTDYLAGTIEGAGNLSFLGASATFDPNVVLNVGTLTDNNGNYITFLANTTYAGAFDLIGNGGVNLNSIVLDLTGTAALDGYLDGYGGTLEVSAQAELGGLLLQNGQTLLDAGTITEDAGLTLGATYNSTTAATLIISKGDVFNIITDSGISANGAATVTNAGLFEKTADLGTSYVYAAFNNASTGTLNVASGTLDLLDGGTLAGTIEGAGQLYLQNNNGTATLAAGAVLSVATFNQNETLVLESSRTFAGTYYETNLLELNSFALALTGVTALDSAVQGPGTLTVSHGDINGLYLYGNATLIDKGTITQDGGFNLNNSASDSVHISIATGAVFDLLTNNAINSLDTPASVINAGLFERTGDYGTNAIIAYFTNTSTGTINAVRGYLDFTEGGSFAGTITGGKDGTIADGGIIIGGGTFALAATAVVSVAEIELQNGDLTLGANLAYTGSFSGTGGSLSLDGHTLTATAPYLGGFYLTGPGTFDVSGTATLSGLGQISGSTLVDKGTIIQDGGYQLGYSSTDASELSIVSGATFDIITDNYIYGYGNPSGASIVNNGLFEKTADNGFSGIQTGFTNTSTGIINVAYGTLGFQNGTAVLAGKLEGAGEIELQSSFDTITSTNVTVGTLDVASYPTLATNLTYGGYFYLSYGDTLFMEANTLNLTGTADLIGAFSGTGAVTVSGSAIVQLLDLYGGETLVDTGTIIQTDELRFSLNDTSNDSLKIAATGIYDITNDSNFHNYTNTGTEAVSNAGLLEKTGDSGLSELEVTLSNTGTVLVDSGTLQIDNVTNMAAGTLTGGSWSVDAGLEGPTLALQGGTIGVIAAKVTLSGAGADLLAGGTALESSLTSIATGGALDVLSGRGFTAANAISDSGLIVLSGGTLATPALTIAGTLSGNGTVTGPVTDNGVIDVTGTHATLAITGSLGGTGSVLIGAGDALIIGAGAGPAAITFGGSLSALTLDTPLSLTSTLTSLTAGDTIDLAGLAAKSATISGGDLIVSLTAGGTVSYALASPNALDRAAVHGDGSGGSDITIFRQAAAGAIYPTPVNFGQAHAGAKLIETYTIGNTQIVDPYSENLDAAMGAHGAKVTDSGSFTGLAPGATNNSALKATLVTGTGGLITGTATVNLYTDGSTVPGDGLGTLALKSETVSLTGTIFNYATAGVTPNPEAFGQHHVGDVIVGDVTVTNKAVAGKYSENLDASFSGTSADLTGSGSISELVAGSAASTALALTLASGTAGVESGRATLALTSDGAGIDTLGTTALAPQTITANATLFNYATASTAAPNPIAFGQAHVGASLSTTLTIANKAAAGKYSENLDASFSGTSSDLTTGGTLSELSAGSTNTSLIIGLASAVAGVETGSTTLGLVSDGSTIDTLGTTALGSQTIAVSGTLFNYATASITPKPISFGQAHVGSTLSQLVDIDNAAAAGAYSENLDAKFAGTSNNVIATGSVSGLTAGASNASAMQIELRSGTAGIDTGTAAIGLISDGSGIDTLGTTTLTTQTVTVSGTLFNEATAALVTKTVSFGQHHVGDALSQLITLKNSAAAGPYSENLDATFSGTSAVLSGSTGSVSELAAGGTSTNGLDLVLNSGTAGTLSGTATLGLVSDGSTIDTLGTTALAGQTVTASGTLFNYATASTIAPVNFGIVHVGQSLAKHLSLTNKAAAGKYSENLDASFSGTSADFTGTGSISELLAGKANSTSLAVTLSSATAGTISGAATLGLVSDGKNIDTLGTTVLNGETVALTGTVNNYATASIEAISGGATLSGTGNTITLNFGSLKKGSAAGKENIGILNSASGPADNLSGSFSLSGTSGFTDAGFTAFSGEAAGHADTAPTITFSTGTVGVHTETIVIDTTGSNASGYKGALTAETLIVTGTITAAAAMPMTGAQAAASVPALSPAASPAVLPAKAAAPVAATATFAGAGALSTTAWHRMDTKPLVMVHPQ